MQIVVVSRHHEPWDIGVFTSVGSDPRSKHYLLLKSRIHYRAGFAPLRIDALPGLRFVDRGSDPQRQQRRQDADQEHVAPSPRTISAYEQPDEGGEKEADAETALHQAGTFAACLLGPQLGHDRGAGRPFRADGDADQKPQNGKRNPVE